MESFVSEYRPLNTVSAEISNRVSRKMRLRRATSIAGGKSAIFYPLWLREGEKGRKKGAIFYPLWLREEKRGRKKGEKGGKGKKEEEDHQVTGRAPAAF